MLVLEVKGQDTQRDQTKREFLDEWVKAVNQHDGFGQWQWAVSKNPADVKGIIQITHYVLRTTPRLPHHALNDMIARL